jgi:hypothetical protein
MATLLLDELVAAESDWRPIVVAEQPLFGDLPIETVEPNPNHQRHWMFATDNHKILAHVYKPEYVLRKFEEVVAPLFSQAYGFKPGNQEIHALAKRLVQDTFTYLLFHELYHPVFCPKSKDDMEKFDIALKNGIKREEPALSDTDIVNKAGNSRNAMWDLFIDTFFQHYAQGSQAYGRHIERIFQQRGYGIGSHRIKNLPDGIITAWDVLELVDQPPQTLFYPITRAMYSLQFCRSEELRGAIFDYFRQKMGRRISDADLEKAVVGSLSGAVKYLDESDLRRIGLDRNRFIDAVVELYRERGTSKANAANQYVVRAITEIGTRVESRYPSLEGIIEPLSRYIDLQKEEKRDGAYTEGQQGQGSGQTSPNQSGGGAEQVLQSIISQNDPDADNMVPSIANDQSPPRSVRKVRLSNLAKDEYYKRRAQEIPIKSPLREAVTIEVGKKRIPVIDSTLLLTPDQVLNLPMDQINQFQLETGIQCFFQLSEHQYRLDRYRWDEVPIKDFTYVKSGILLPDNLIFRVDGSASMLSPGGGAFVGSGSRYDMLMHVVYGITKSAANAAGEMDKKIYVVGVSYSVPGQTKISEPVEIQEFWKTPNNPAKEVLLNPDGSSTHHDIKAYAESYKKLHPGKVLDIVITDGDLDTDHDQSIAEVRRIVSVPENSMAYFPIFHEGAFAMRVKRLADVSANLTYQPFLNFGALQSFATGIIVQYNRTAERFGSQ